MKRVLLAAVVLLGGCATAESGRSINLGAVAGFQQGVTTIDQVRSALGQPASTTKNSNGTTVLTYSHVKSQANGFTGAVKVGADTATFVFDASGILRRSTVTNSNL